MDANTLAMLKDASSMDWLNDGMKQGMQLAQQQEDIGLKRQQAEAQKMKIQQEKLDGTINSLGTINKMASNPKMLNAMKASTIKNLADLGNGNAEALYDVAIAQPQAVADIQASQQLLKNYPNLSKQTGLSSDPTLVQQQLNDLLLSPDGADKAAMLKANLMKLAGEESKNKFDLDKARITQTGVSDRAENKASDKAASQVIDLEDKYRKEYQGSPLYKEANDLAASFAKIKNADLNTEGPGQQALIYLFNKMLDPGSVVRETEYANAAANSGKITEFLQLGQKLKSGEGLSAKQIELMKEVAANLNESAQGMLGKEKDKYRNLAKTRKLDVKNILLDEPAPEEAPKDMAPDKTKAPPKIDAAKVSADLSAKGYKPEQIQAYLSAKGIK